MFSGKFQSLSGRSTADQKARGLWVQYCLVLPKTLWTWFRFRKHWSRNSVRSWQVFSPVRWSSLLVAPHHSHSHDFLEETRALKMPKIDKIDKINLNKWETHPGKSRQFQPSWFWEDAVGRISSISWGATHMILFRSRNRPRVIVDHSVKLHYFFQQIFWSNANFISRCKYSNG